MHDHHVLHRVRTHVADEADDRVPHHHGEQDCGRQQVEPLRLAHHWGIALDPPPSNRRDDHGKRRRDERGPGPRLQRVQHTHTGFIRRTEVDPLQQVRRPSVGSRPHEGEHEPADEHRPLVRTGPLAGLAAVDADQPIALHERVLGVPQPGDGADEGEADVLADDDGGQQYERGAADKPSDLGHEVPHERPQGKGRCEGHAERHTCQQDHQPVQRGNQRRSRRIARDGDMAGPAESDSLPPVLRGYPDGRPGHESRPVG